MPVVTALARLRPSNLIILCALPFIVWLFAASENYGRSLAAIVGIEAGARALIPGFVLALAASGAGFAAGLLARPGGRPGRAFAIAALALAAGALLAATGIGQPFFASVVANAVDPFTSPLVVQGETPRRLTDAAATATAFWARAGIVGWLLIGALATAALTFPASSRWGRTLLLAVNGTVAAGLLLFAHIGFASGIAISIRAAVLAYLLAVVLGLLWVGMMQLKPHRRTPWLFAAASFVFLAIAGWQFAQPRIGYALVGGAEGTIGVVKGTPQHLIDAILFGGFPGAPEGERPIRSFATMESALAAVSASDGVSGALVLDDLAPAGAPQLWTVWTLPETAETLGLLFLVLAIATGILTLGGLMHRRHPLSVAAEFVVDMLRGIPMLVIVLYIGLPLAGAVKSASGGFIDPPNLLRGIVAMAIAYSAYLAEIFRAGINAVPQGQIEAARSLGLSGWATARHVVLPQAFRIVLPPMGNEFIAILKDTSLLSILSIRDITQRMREFQSASFLPFAPYNSAAILYLLLTLVAASLIHAIERKHRVGHR